MLQKGLCWKVINEKSTNFWTDFWLDSKPLKDLALDPLEENKLNNKVCKYWTKEGGWNWQEFGSSLSASILLRIASITLSTDDTDKLRIGWRGTTFGKFSVKSSHVIGAGWDALQGWKGRSCIRKLQLQERAKVFVWTMAHDRVLTNVERYRSGLTISADCGRGANRVEDLLPLVRDNSKSSEVWYQLVPPHLCFNFFFLPLREWLECNLWSKEIASEVEKWTDVALLLVGGCGSGETNKLL